ncbi:hypothetical protein G4H71_21780 [Rhodococcus triatomae]|uniref:Maltokinase n=1 Tax=Rhodococcus triatomae TaxID=300028 RepID=A0A1G8P392_9NOCA|nr:hypothetical protein [Rhodococcus triatomae]QNG18760.1 hypothetical protein G4H72_08600 [Rhodococcus triatomae]QNG25329.1 hypothetical protein G4H71_21780 [Rhodococcus triatomae]SDI86917.1 maltokinase [Rhodococcus triatomae]
MNAPDPFPGLDEIESRLARWLPSQRWFAAKTQPITSVRILLRHTLAVTEEVRAEHLVVEVELGDASRQVYQVPLGFRATVGHALSAWTLPAASVDRESGRDPDVAYDGLHDPEVIGRYAALLTGDIAAGPFGVHLVEDPVEPVPGVTDGSGHEEWPTRGRALGAEQSNTSVVLGETLLLKMFRRLAPGINPDVELHRALGEAHSAQVARLRAWLDVPLHGARATAAMAQDFEPNAADGWSMALGSVRDLLVEADLYAGELGTDFAAESRRIGSAVADVHASLADRLGSRRTPLADTVAAMRRRLDSALGTVPELADLAPSIRSVFDAAAEGSTSVQRIHGDLHLGQVLRTPERWLLIDFEGEPAKTLEQRRTPDSPLRDIAGMIRSFDYAAHYPLSSTDMNGTASQREFRAREWAQRNADAFTDGYAAAYGRDPRDALPLLRAYELDKAVYEAVYETHHRPRWVALPLAAIRRLLDGVD